MFYTQANPSSQLHCIEENQPLLLDDPEVVWVVESGKLALFATRVKDGVPVDLRRYLLSVSAGGALFGMGLLPREWAFVAVANEATKLYQLPIADFIKRVAAGEAEAIALLEDWIYQLSQAFNNQHTPLKVVQQDFQPHLSLSSGEALQLWQKKVVWVKLQQGNTRWMGVEELTLSHASPAFPLTTAMWLVAENAVTGLMLPTARLESSEELSASLISFHAYFCRYLIMLIQKQAEAELPRLQQRKQLNQQVLEEALGELAGVLQPQQETGLFPQGQPLLVAMGAVARVQGITICPPVGKDLNGVQDAVSAIAHASQIRARRVILADGWWRKQDTPMLGYTSEGQPVALLPAASKGYVIFDPVARTRTPLNQSVARTLAREAHIFYRPLPNVVNSGFDLFQFLTKGYEKDIASILVVGVIGTLLGMIAPQATAILVNYAIPDSDRALVWQIGLVLFAVAFAQLAFQITQNIVTLRVGSAIDNVLQPAIWDRLLRLSPAFFRQYASGDLYNRLISVKLIHQTLNGVTQRTLLSGVFALLNLVLMFVYSWQLALVGVGLGIVALVVTGVSSFLLVRKSRQQQELDGEIQGLTIQLLNGVTKLRVAMAEERAFAAWAKKYSQRMRIKASWQQINDGVSVFNEALPLVSSLLLFAVAMLLMQSRLSIGIFVAFNYAMAIFIKGVTDLSNTVTDIWSIVPLWERAQPILRSQPEYDATKANPGELIGRIALDNVTFRYSENGPVILNNVSLYAEPGEFVAIVGASGSGKSTIFRLLLGFEAALTGSVYYDGKDLAGLDLQALRRRLGVVLQNGKIGSGSIFDNITGGALVSLDQAWEAARMAGLAEDIEQMPMGMHTVISEGGTNLSGGQRQRLLIARSLVLSPKVILMDEATSALDNRTQAIVTESLNKLNATRVVIAHRLSTIRHADRIYVIDAGRVVQVGTFVELMAQEGLFARLVARQLEGAV